MRAIHSGVAKNAILPLIFLTLVTGLLHLPTAAAKVSDSVRLHGHVLPALSQAVLQSRPTTPMTMASPESGSAGATNLDLGLTVVLNRDDEAGFQSYLRDVYNPQSPNFRKFLTPTQVAEKFGPSQQAYDEVAGWLRTQNLDIAATSANRMTLEVHGTRDAVGRALELNVRDYALGTRNFFANDIDPALPARIAPHINAINGLSNLAQPKPMLDHLPDNQVNRALWYALCANQAVNGGPSAYTGGVLSLFKILLGETLFYLSLLDSLINIAQASDLSSEGTGAQYAKCVNQYNKKYHYSLIGGGDPPPPAWQAADGTGQTIGLVEFDSFLMSDVADYITLMGQAAGPLSNVSQVHVNGGATLGANQDEVLLDIDDVLTAAPGAKIVVFDAPFTGPGTSFQGVFNAMINGGVDIISNSWAYCEDQTTLADVQSIDSILQSAAASGISVFTGAGDHGSSCLDGSANVAHVPATSPFVTTVGGTSEQEYPGFTYGTETWWDGSTGTPPDGQGGFGVSAFFGRPGYQDGLTASPMRSIPDVAASADPKTGVMICQASAGGCPTGALYGGTSSSTPLWAAFAALLNQTQGSKLGFFNPQIYPYANSDAFHNAASMGSDFAHVGLGSPNLARLHLHLTGQTVGAVSPTVSIARAYAQTTYTMPEGSAIPLPAFADGQNQTFLVVTLADAYGNPVGGKVVTPSTVAASNVVFTPTSLATDANTGVAIFYLTDTTTESVTVQAVDTSDAITLAQTPLVNFVTPPATSAGIAAAPTSVPADGVSITSITITLKDTLGRPTPGKRVTLAQGSGNSVISGPDPSVTDNNGQITFTATDDGNETVTYTAVDSSDGNQAVPGSAVVTFSNSVASDCSGVPPVAASGFTVSTFASGFPAGDFFYSNVNFGGCSGAGNPAFTGAGVLVPDFPSGNLYKLTAAGGAVSSSDVLSTPGISTGNLIIGIDGNLYGTRFVSGGSFYTGTVIQIDPVTGGVARTLASGLTCPNGLAVDPKSGDLFFDDQCFGGGSDNNSVWRLKLSDSTYSVYATLPYGGGEQQLAFAPNGTLYALSGGGSGGSHVVRITGTTAATPGIVTDLGISADCCGLAIGTTTAGGDAQTLLLHADSQLETVNVADGAVVSVLATGDIGVGSIGADGCLYSGTHHVVYKIANSASSCTNTPTSPAAIAALTLSPAILSPNPTQGGSRTFTAQLQKLTAAAGTPVYFSVNGANSKLKQVRLDANGEAQLSYVSVNSGEDDIVAAITVGGITLTSNVVRVTWDAGPHTTFVSLDPGPHSGKRGQPVTLMASLSDISASPATALAGQTLHFSLGGSTCTGTTDANGLASCSVVIGSGGELALSATFAATGGYLASSDAGTFNALAVTSAATPPGSIVATPALTAEALVLLALGMLALGVFVRRRMSIERGQT